MLLKRFKEIENHPITLIHPPTAAMRAVQEGAPLH